MNIYILERSKINQTIARIIEELSVMEQFDQLRFWQLLDIITWSKTPQSFTPTTFHTESKYTLLRIIRYLIDNKILLSEVCCKNLDNLHTIFSVKPGLFTMAVGEYLLDVAEYRDHP